MFEYKLIPVPAPSKKAKGRKTVSARMAHALTEIMNDQAKEGWVYSGQEHYTIEEKSGLMGKEKQVDCRYMVFHRMQADSSPQQDTGQTAKADAPAPAPLPDPLPGPLAPADPDAEDGHEPTRIFSPFDPPDDSAHAPALGPASKD